MGPLRLPLLFLLMVVSSACGGTTPIMPTAVLAAAPAPNRPEEERFSISGVVRDADEGVLIGEVEVRLRDRFEPRTTTTDELGRYRFEEVAQAGVGMIFSRSGYRDVEIEQVLPVKDLTINVALSRECAARPLPVQLSYSVAGGTVTFTWTAVDGADEYRLAVGQWDYVAPVFEITTGGTTHVWANAPSGAYHARVQGRNACGFGNAANELKVVVP